LKPLLLFSVFLLGWLNFAQAEINKPEPQLLLDEMSKASRNLNYDGVFIYRRDSKMETMRIIHKAGEDGSYEKLTSLTGSAREVIRDKEQVKCIFPDDKKVVVDKSRTGKLVSSFLPSPVKTISDNYHFELAGEDRIAGMDTWVVNIRPNDKFRYGYQLWIEKQSRLLLKSELKNQLGVTLEQIMFTQLQVGNEIDDALLKPSVSGEDFTWVNNSTKQKLEQGNKSKWEVTSMPDGFAMSNQEKETMGMSQMPIDHFVYSDGLAMVSIYIEKLEQKDDSKTGLSSFGGVNTYSTQVNDHQITAVGEVPKATVQLMANSVKSLH
jgi:sigma-E factor negative regulatory protein RseB